MKIAMIGNYKSNNAGDDFYLYLMRQRFPDHQFFSYHDISVQEADAVIFGGGGLLNPEHTDGARLKYLDAAQREGKPTCTMSVGSVGDTVKMPFLKEYHLLKKCKFITVRDLFAYNNLRTINPRTFLLPDLVWNYKVEKHTPSASQPPLSRGEYTVGVMLRHCKKFKDDDLVAATLKLMTHLQKTKNATFLFFSTYGDKLTDHTLVNKIQNNNIKYKILSPHKTVDMIEHLNTFRHIDLLIGMPYHGFILSCLYGVPAIGWAYENKIIELANTLRLNVIYDVTETDSLLSENSGIRNNATKFMTGMVQREAELHFKLFERVIINKL